MPSSRLAVAGSLPPTGIPTHPLLLVDLGGSADLAVLRPALSAAGWRWLEASDSERARWLASVRSVSLCVLAGQQSRVWEAAELIRPVTKAPLVVLGAVPPEMVVTLIARGVDAVIESHGDVGEVVARVAAVLRRGDPTFTPGVRFLEAEDLRVDLLTRECRHEGVTVTLSPTEYAVLVLLMSHADRVLPVSTIVREGWGWTPSDGRNALRIVVNRLRRKLGDDSRSPRYVASVRGAGYRFVGRVDQLGDTVGRARWSESAILLSWVEELARTLSGCESVEAACDCVLDTLVATGIADAAAVFCVKGSRMRLVGARNMSAAWRAAVAHGVPLDPSFASAQSVLTGHPVGFGDLEAACGTFGSTAEQLIREGVRAGCFLPIEGDRGIWGSLGVARWSDEPFDENALALCRAMVSIFRLVIGRHGPGRQGVRAAEQSAG